MTASVLADIEQLSISERIQLVEDIWDSIAADADQVPLSEAHRQILDRRLEAHYQNPEGGAPWPEVRARLMTRR